LGAPICYTRKDCELEKEARRITENRLMEEEARYGHEDHHRRLRREQEETKSLTEKVKEVVGVK
jgi:Skp family chaperone for outer membrane proteins